MKLVFCSMRGLATLRLGLVVGVLTIIFGGLPDALALTADGKNEVPCPEPSEWKMESCPSETSPSSITPPLSLCATVGDSVCKPETTVPKYSAGKKKRTTYDSDCNPGEERADITFSAEVKWEPKLPDNLIASFSSEASVIITSSDPSLCQAPPKVALGTVTWTVRSMPIGISAITWKPKGQLPDDGTTWKYGQDQVGATKLVLWPSHVADFELYANCGVKLWKLKVTKAEAQISQRVRLHPNGQQEITFAMIEETTSCATLKNMRDSLQHQADQGPTDGPYYVIAAIQAHEDVHSADIKKACDDAFAAFKATVEALTFGKDDTCDPTYQKGMLQESGPYYDAKKKMDAAILDGMRVSMGKEGKADGDLGKAEQAVVKPFIDKINERLNSLNCPP